MSSMFTVQMLGFLGPLKVFKNRWSSILPLYIKLAKFFESSQSLSHFFILVKFQQNTLFNVPHDTIHAHISLIILEECKFLRVSLEVLMEVVETSLDDQLSHFLNIVFNKTVFGFKTYNRIVTN
jgi:hypothetical protein